MRRIGTTAEGGAIVEIGQAELVKLGETGDLLAEIAACALVDAGDQLKRDCQRATFVAPAKLKKAAKVKSRATGSKVCSRCGKTKPVSEFYNGHGRCNPCFRDADKERRAGVTSKDDQRAARRAEGLKVVARVQKTVKAGGTFAPRERDPALDRPVDGSGRVARVGGEG